jgi:hypothetical protein
MYKRDDTRSSARRLPAGWLVSVATWLVLATPFAAVGSLSTTLPANATAAGTADKPAAGLYQIRCWQFGRLLFEQNRISLPAEGAQYGIKIGGTDRNDRPFYVAETKNATCLIRGAAEERHWPR